MKRSELIKHYRAIDARNADALTCAAELAPAPLDRESLEHQADTYAEGLFLRVFTAYESDLERLFLHYVTGGRSLDRRRARTFLSVRDENLARRVVLGGASFLSWSTPKDIRDTVENFIDQGWPISDVMRAHAQDLADIEYVRNRIAHESPKARRDFNAVQRNLLKTERLFRLTPGHLLRMRSQRLGKLHIQHYLEVMHATLEAIVEPPL